MKNKIDWIIHLCANGAVCETCGEVENGYLPFACNAHTHGMEKYNHIDFQMVLRTSNEEIMRILNTFGLKVKAGERFKNGDLIEGIYLNCPVRLSEFTENGRTVLRVVVPDKENRFPEDRDCEYPYSLQMIHTDALYKLGGYHKCQ